MPQTHVQSVLIHTDPPARTALFITFAACRGDGHLESESIAGGGADDRLDVHDHAADRA